MPYIGTDINYGNLAKQTGTGDGADTTPIAALTYTVPSSESILVFLDGVCQVPSTDFTATGTTLTFTTAPANGVAILVMFLGRSLDIGTPADNTVATAKLVNNAVDETKLKDALIGDFSDATVTASDTFLHGDATDSGNTKRDTVQGILDLATGGSNHTGMIGGLRLTNTGSADTIGFEVGIARDYADGVNMELSSAITKTTASWAVGTGNGALDTGSVANNSGYGVYLIRRSDTGVVDILISLDKTANMATATKPTGYDQWRLIGWFRTKGSANIMPFLHNGDYFYLRSSDYPDFDDNTITANTYETATTTAPPFSLVYWHIETYNASETGDSAGFSIRTGDGLYYGNISSTRQNFYWNHNSSDTYDGMDMFTHCPVDASSQLQYATAEGAGTVRIAGEILEINLVTRSNP